ncbi:hypothetical protein JCM17380_44220 [Desulfosporosinus burensis]
MEEAGRNTGECFDQSDIRVMAGGTHPCVPPCSESGFKAEFGYDSRKGFAPCERDPLGLVRYFDPKHLSLGYAVL